MMITPSRVPPGEALCLRFERLSVRFQYSPEGSVYTRFGQISESSRFM